MRREAYQHPVVIRQPARLHRHHLGDLDVDPADREHALPVVQHDLEPRRRQEGELRPAMLPALRRSCPKLS